MKTRIAIMATGLFVLGIVVYTLNAQSFCVSGENPSLTVNAAAQAQSLNCGNCEGGEQKKEGCSKSKECEKKEGGCKKDGDSADKSDGCKKQEGSSESGCPKSSS
jgi:hypothetical protein